MSGGRGERESGTRLGEGSDRRMPTSRTNRQTQTYGLDKALTYGTAKHDTAKDRRRTQGRRAPGRQEEARLSG